MSYACPAHGFRPTEAVRYESHSGIAYCDLCHRDVDEVVPGRQPACQTCGDPMSPIKDGHTCFACQLGAQQ